jgi:D-alanine-D-alanine ligase
MRVCVLYYEDTDGFSPAEFLQQYPCEWEMITLEHSVRERITTIAAQNRFDVFFNLCDASVYEDYPGLEVVQVLEDLNLAFTGSDSKFYDPTREEMQRAAEANGVGFARGYRVSEEEDLDRLAGSLRFPLMVKHPQSYASMGMTRESRVENSQQLHQQFIRMKTEFGGARVEEFIVGREYNVFVVDNPDDLADPFVYPPTELIFPPDEEFWHTDIKWDYSVPFEFRRVDDEMLSARLKDAGRRLYLALGGTGYGRCDVRVKEDGSLFMLEINANAGILYRPEEYGPADYMILYDAAGYFGFFDRIFRSALVRQKLRSLDRAPGT